MATPATLPAKKIIEATAVYPYKKPDWVPPGLEGCHAFWIPEPWGFWMAPVLVTPTMASAWLSSNIKTNRNVINSLVEQIFYDLVESKWLPTHQGVAFNQNKEFFDGQNRLTAIVQSNTPAHLLVSWGVNDGSMQVVDTGRSRTIKASAMIAGKDFTSRHIATLKRALTHFSYTKSKASRTQIFYLIEEHREALDWTLKTVASHPWNKADVSAGFFRAYYHIDPVILERIAKVLRTGMPDYDYDQNILLLRDRVMLGTRGSDRAKVYTPAQLDMDRYYKTMRTCVAIVRGETIEKLTMPKELDYYQEVMPLPASVADWVAKGKPRAGRSVYWPQKVGPV